MTIGDVVMVMTLLFSTSYHLIFIGNMLNGFIRTYGEIEEGLQEILIGHDIVDAGDAPALNVTSGKLVFDDVTFSYGEQMVFKNFSLTIAPGERVGIVGGSGAGKTTFVSLLLRQHDIQQGAILIDGQNIAEVSQDSLRSAISVVPQDPQLFHRSIRENISYGNIVASDDEIQAAAQTAYVHEFVDALPERYDTLVGERGVKLSGGQRQRVVIARAILKNAPILVLDEATSALDSASEVAIQRGLHALMDGKTVIAIAHRLSTLREMDRIVVLDKGGVAETGTHEELIAHGGVYASLWSHQVGGFLQD
jgi:ATP-binding cassette subfamily B protein